MSERDGDAHSQAGSDLLQQGWAAVDAPADLRTLGDDVLQAARRVFALPEERKAQFVDPQEAGQSGWLARDQDDRPDEIWQIGGGRALRWPDELRAELDAIERLKARCIDFSRGVLTDVARTVGLPDDAVSSTISAAHSSIRLLHYRPRRPDLGFGAHTDLGVATFFAGETSPALELQDHSGAWQRARSGWVLAAGEMLPVLTRQQGKAGLHRVRSLPEERWAAVVFMHPTPDQHLGVDESGQPVDARAFFAKVRVKTASGQK
jgi:isopenicillin N synthase-like dioxygenase